MLNFLNGYKTYILGTSMVLGGIVQLINGDNEGIRTIQEGFGFIFLRKGISTLK